MPQKKKINNFLKKAVIPICTFGIGIVVSKFYYDLPYIKIDEKINLIGILSIVTTLFAAYIVAEVINKENTDKRKEKDILLKRIDDIYNLIEDSNQNVISGTIPYQQATFHIKRINTLG